ncbi:MAG: ArsR/SmtB family transcription factor [Candidatus Thorarchaeota archaeon]
MSDDIDKIRKELEEVRRLKEELRREVDDVRLAKEDVRRRREDVQRLREEARRRRAEVRRAERVKPVKPIKPPKPPRAPRVARLDFDLEDLTDSLENMMDGLGQSIEMSLRNIEGLKIPGIRIQKGRRRTKKRKEQQSMIESIPPERVAQIVAPLGNEERLKILDYLKTGGKSFNEIEEFTGKTGSSLTHHLNPLIDAGYVVKGEVRGTYYVTVEGRLAYRLSQWLTHRVEKQRERRGNNGESVDVEFEDAGLDTDLEKAEEHLASLAEDLEEAANEVESHQDELEEAREALEEAQEAELEEEEELEDEIDDLDALDWED